LLPPETGGLWGVILGAFVRSFLEHPALRQKQFQREWLALVVGGLAHAILRHYGDDTAQRCTAAYWGVGE